MTIKTWMHTHWGICVHASILHDIANLIYLLRRWIWFLEKLFTKMKIKMPGKKSNNQQLQKKNTKWRSSEKLIGKKKEKWKGKKISFPPVILSQRTVSKSASKHECVHSSYISTANNTKALYFHPQLAAQKDMFKLHGLHTWSFTHFLVYDMSLWVVYVPTLLTLLCDLYSLSAVCILKQSNPLLYAFK